MKNLVKPINEEVIWKITKRASLQYNDSNPGFVSFQNMNPSAARSSVRKLIESGYDAKISPILKNMIIVQREASVFGNSL